MCLDALLTQNVGRATDILAQRFRAVEMAAQQGAWAQGQHLELLPAEDATQLSVQELQLLTRKELLHNGLAEARQKTAKGAGAA